VTWVLRWSARSSDISSRAAQETNLPEAGHKWTGGDLGNGGGVGVGGGDGVREILKLRAITRLRQKKKFKCN